jgi:hypothetical protein
MLSDEIAENHRQVFENQIHILERNGCFNDPKNMYGPSLVLENMIKDLESSQEQRLHYAQLK